MSARILPTMTSAEYHRDPCAVPSLSASCATTIVTRSPYHAWLNHPRLGGVKREATDSMDSGSLLHGLVLGGCEIEEIVAENFKTKAAQQARDAARARGAIPVLAGDLEAAQALAVEVKTALAALGYDLSRGESEVSVEWTEESERGPVVCRGRMDWLDIERAVIVDLKTCRSAHPRAVQSHCMEYGYDIQRAAYTSALRKLRPEMAGRERFEFLFIEELPEGSKRRAIVQPVTFDGSMRELGVRRWRRAVETWATCRDTDRWPAYVEDGCPMVVEAPAWAIVAEGM